jgi:hypothetical protein
MFLSFDSCIREINVALPPFFVGKQCLQWVDKYLQRIFVIRTEAVFQSALDNGT